jgi:hypothetical protein
VSNATSVTIDPGLGTFASSGDTIVLPAATTTYILTAANAAGSTTAMTQVIVSGAPSPLGGLPVIDYFTADPPVISAGRLAMPPVGVALPFRFWLAVVWDRM